MNWILCTNIEDLPGEKWISVKGLEERYEVSNFGRVKSLIKKPQILRKTLSSGRYKVLLYKRRGRYENESVGRLVATAFIREPKENEVLRYKDGNFLNDFAENVFWDGRIGISNVKNAGNSNGMAKLNELQVIEIKACLNQGHNMKHLAEKYNVAYTTIKCIKSGRKWKNV